MSSIGGFWSYVHADDDADLGRVVQLAKDVAAQYEAITAEPIELFLDRNALAWGDDWLQKVDTSLATIAFFIPVISPRYFTSIECRRELQTFAHRAESLGVAELILPLVYIDVPALHEAHPQDEAVKLVKTYQWEDWRELRFDEPGSKQYRAAVAKLAQRLVDINQTLAARAEVAVGAAVITAPQPGEERLDSEADDEDAPGRLDLMALAEEVMPKWSDVVVEVGILLDRLSEVVTGATADFERADKQNKGFAGRIVVARRLAAQLAPITRRMAELGNEYTAHLYDVDAGVRAMLAAGIEAAVDEHQKPHVCEFFASVAGMSEAAASGVEGFRYMVNSMQPVEAMSRDLRPNLRQLREGLNLMIEGQSVTDEWARIIATSGVDCGGSVTPEAGPPSAG
jgi:hypothetical protein